jgi:pre-mRNA cleavage complex 2 protein Pcf11
LIKLVFLHIFTSSSPVFFFIFRFESLSSGRSDKRFQEPAPSLWQQINQQQSHANDELPRADPLVLDHIAQDAAKTVNLFDVPKEVRFYGDTAVVMLSWDDPREIGFQDGVRKVTFDDRGSVLCSLNDTYKECNIYGSTHRLVINIYCYFY